MAKMNSSATVNQWTKLIEAAGLDESDADKWLVQVVGGLPNSAVVCAASSAPEADDYDGFVIYGGISGNAFEYTKKDGYYLYARSNGCGNVKLIVQPLE